MHAICSTLIQGLHKYAKEHQYQRAVIGLSGGLDSTLAFYIAVRAFGAANVTALLLPEIGITPQEDIDHAKAIVDHFEAPSFYQPINNFLVDFNFVPWDKDDAGFKNIKPRIRALLLQNYAEANKALLLGTANKSDLLLGYGSATGEFVGDLHIFGDLLKTELTQLADFVGLPLELVKKAPSKQLAHHDSDFEEFGAPWGRIDEALRQLEDGKDPDALIEKGMESHVVHKVARLLQENSGKFSHLPVMPAGKVRELLRKAQAAEAGSLS